MKELKLIETIKEEVIVKQTEREIGKIILDYENITMTVIGKHFTLIDIQNAILKAEAEINVYISTLIAGDTIFPGNWTIILKSEE